MAPKLKMPADEDIERLKRAANMLRVCAADPVCRSPPAGMEKPIRQFVANSLLADLDSQGPKKEHLEQATGDVAALLVAYRQTKVDERVRIAQVSGTLDAIEARVGGLDNLLNRTDVGRMTRLMIEDAVLLKFTEQMIRDGAKADEWRAKHNLAPMFPVSRDKRRKRLLEDLKTALSQRFSLAAARRAATEPSFQAPQPIYAEVLDKVIGNDSTREADQLAQMAVLVERNLFSGDRGLVDMLFDAVRTVRTSLALPPPSPPPDVADESGQQRRDHGPSPCFGPTDNTMLAWGALELYQAWQPKKPGTSHPLAATPSSSPEGTFVRLVCDLHTLVNIGSTPGKRKPRKGATPPAVDDKKKMKPKPAVSLVGANRVKLVLAALEYQLLKPTAFQGLRKRKPTPHPPVLRKADAPAIRPQPEQRGRTWNSEDCESLGDYSMVPDEQQD